MNKILIIEDIPDNAELAHKILVSASYEVMHAADAETGMLLAEREIPDLILLDLGLPDYDGQTVAAYLKKEPQTAHIPIIAFTAWPADTARPMAFSYGCDGFISKPITSVVAFLDTIKSHINK